MLRIDLGKATRWLDLGYGVRVEVMRMGTGVVMRAQTALRAAREDEAAPMLRGEFSLAIAREAIITWEGVGDADGNPITPDPDTIAALMDVFPIFSAFETQYVNPGLVLVAEGNGSAPSQNGTLAGVPDIATDVPVFVRSARDRSTPH